MSASTENEIQSAYRGSETAQKYVAERFVSELYRLLHERQVCAVQRVMDEARPNRTLEVAPGPGRLTRDVRPTGELVCLEYNEGMIAEGKAACPSSVKWIQGNAFELPFGQQFDFLYSFRFVRHFHREDRGRLYEQFRKVLRPGGWLVLDAVNQVVSEPLRQANPAAYPIYDKLYRNEEELRTELAEGGFEVERIVPVQRWFGPQSKAQMLLGPRSRLLCRWAIRTLERMRRGPALEWIVTCRRA
jgi:ubiquinone/menaquinone biosynthesis C-methylase UbiE